MQSCSTNGSMSTVSKVETGGLTEQDYIGLSEVTSYPKSSVLKEAMNGLQEEELNLGLSLTSSSCGVKRGVLESEFSKGRWGCNANWIQTQERERGTRFLTAKDFPGSSGGCGAKRVHNDSSVQEVTSVPSNQVVGWPPIRAYRMNSLATQSRVPVVENIESNYDDKMSSTNTINKKSENINNNNTAIQRAEKVITQFVKVNMDGLPIGRKVDLNAHGCYETLAQALEDMFQSPTATSIRQTGVHSALEKEHGGLSVESKASKLLDGSSEFVLTYEDKEGDWMLVGDVPWGMFLSTVKRLRIMRTSEANGLAPRFQDKGIRQRCKPV
ncbi:hypothetical protein AMTRI_Chr07g25600 [Amborella trichopoda]